MTTAEMPILQRAGEGEALWHGDALWEFKVRSEDTDHRFWLAEITADTGWGSPVHLHTREDETFVVLEGGLRVQVDDERFEVPEGGTVFLPRGRPHAYAVAEGRTRFVVMGTPGGFDGWFFRTGEPARARTLPPPTTEEPDWGAYVAALAEYGVQFIAPPPS